MIGFCKIEENKFKKFVPSLTKVGTGAPIPTIFFSIAL